jgi:hypothetical protein
MEYITKQQAIDLVKSMEVLIGCTGASVLTKCIEGLEGYRGIATNATFEGEKVMVLEGLTKHWPKSKEE